jgi:hypothetical protein
MQESGYMLFYRSSTVSTDPFGVEIQLARTSRVFASASHVSPISLAREIRACCATCYEPTLSPTLVDTEEEPRPNQLEARLGNIEPGNNLNGVHPQRH